MRSLKITSKFILLLNILYFFPCFILIPQVNAAPNANFIYAYELQLPTKPTPPYLPTSPKEGQKKAADAPQQKTPSPASEPPEAASQPNQPPQQSQPTNKETAKEPADTEQAAEAKNALPPAAADKSLKDANETNEKAADKTTKTLPPKNNAEKFFDSFLNYTLYSILILAIIACTGYLYFTTPKDKPTAVVKAPSNKPATAKIKPQTNKEAIPSIALKDIKITNRSLLEQLIKYDLENYGEIRTNLDYEQPAYVEKLIRKYGGSDQNKVNRAIHLFYQQHHKK